MESDDHPAVDEHNRAPGAATPGQARRGRAVVDFRPYPTAPTRTRRSPANSGRGTRRGNHPPTPSTIWFTPTRSEAADGLAVVTVPTDETDPRRLSSSGGVPDSEQPGATWPLPVLARAVTSFTEPGATVLLLPWPAVARDGHGATVPPAAAAAVAELDRRPRVGDVHTPAGDEEDHLRPDGAGPVDLLITVMPARHDAAEHADTIARLAARALRLGGVLAVLTQCDRSRGALVDPTGPMVTAGQNADLLYLQHVVAVHLPPVHLRPNPGHRADGAADGRAPLAHRRVHSDVLVFAQPHDDGARPTTSRSPRT